MKCITREVKMYNYIFANIDLETGSAYNLKEFTLPQPMGQREIRKYCEENNQAVLIKKSTEPRKFALPLADFVQYCEEYAEKVKAGTAPPITPEDEAESDNDGPDDSDIDE